MYDYITQTSEKNLKPITKQILIETFKKLGIKRGDILLVHSSLSELGYVIGGAETVFLALVEMVGSEGTLVVPSQTVEISYPSTWQYPPVPEEWFEIIRENLPAYHEKKSFSKAMGQFSNFLGHLPTAKRSQHPMYSFTAVGLNAEKITSHHEFDFPFGQTSPLAKLYDMGAKILIIGTDFETNTSLHLSENFLGREVIIESSKIYDNGVQKWTDFKNVDLDKYDDYLEIQQRYFQQTVPNMEMINDATIYCFDMKSCVDFTTEYYIRKEKS
ncbi:MAG: AAC(3) family N-acetyltransferase [Streptococcus sp.]|nr:AAC(3) family N-acetyltransferase [Streptococcus sp.]